MIYTLICFILDINFRENGIKFYSRPYKNIFYELTYWNKSFKTLENIQIHCLKKLRFLRNNHFIV